MRSENAPARHGSNVRHVLEDTRISQEADNPQMIKRGAKSAT